MFLKALMNGKTQATLILLYAYNGYSNCVFYNLDAFYQFLNQNLEIIGVD